LCRFCYRLYVATSKPKWKYFHIGQAFSKKKKKKFLYSTVEMKRRYWQQQMCIKISHGYLRKSIETLNDLQVRAILLYFIVKILRIDRSAITSRSTAIVPASFYYHLLCTHVKSLFNYLRTMPWSQCVPKTIWRSGNMAATSTSSLHTD